MAVDVENVFISLGLWGKWQVRQMVWVILSNFPIAFHLLAIVFIGYEPPFRCRLNDTEVYDHVDKCHLRNVSSNATEACLFGYEYDTPVEASIVSQWNLVCDQSYMVKLAQTILVLGQFFGALVFTHMADVYGRKRVFIICQLVYFVMALSTAFLPNINLFMAIRFFLGALQQGIGMSACVMSLELMPVTNRTIANLVGGLLWGLPVTLLTVFGFVFRETSWRYQQLALTTSSAVVIVHILIMEESIRWLYANGRDDEGRRLIIKAATVNRVPLSTVFSSDRDQVLQTASSDVQEMISFKRGVKQPGKKIVVDANKVQDSTSMIQFVKDATLRKITLVMIYVWFVDSLVYYALFFTSSTLAGNRFINYFLNGVVELPAYVIGYFLLINFGRRLTSLIFHSISGLSLIISVAFYQDNDTSIAALRTVFSVLGKFGISGAFCSLFLYTPELYPTNLRSSGAGVGSAAGRIGSMIAPFATLLLADAPWVLGIACGLLIFIVCGLLLLLPETSDKELPQTIAHVREMCRERLTIKTLFRRHRTFSVKQ